MSMPPTQMIRGLLIPMHLTDTPKNTEDALDYVPHDGDIIIASYPKTGVNWLQYIILQIISNGEFFPTFRECFMKHVPFLPVTGTAVLENLGKPRVYRHHFPYNMVQKNDKAKYIYIYRKPEDTAISYKHFSNDLFKETVKLDEFFEDFISGKVPYGLYFDHLLSYFAHKDDKNMLFISYEKLLCNSREEILRIAKYLGEAYFQTLSENGSVMDKIIQHTSFDYMKKHLSLTLKSDGDREVIFFRKGIIGDGKKSLNQGQLKRLKDLAKQKLEGTYLLKEWLDE